MSLGFIGLCYNLRGHDVVKISLATNNIDQAFWQSFFDFFVVKLKLIEGGCVIGAVDEYDSVCTLEVQIENRPVCLLPRCVIIGKPAVLSGAKRAVDHDCPVSCILIGLIEISD